MLCTSLRKRREWISVPQILLALAQPRWQEQNLETYDLALALPRRRQEDHQELFHLLLLSQLDVEPMEASMERIERLYHQVGGLNLGIVFLLNEQSRTGNCTVAFLKLQASLQATFEIPILPLFSISSLQMTLFSFQRQLVQARSAVRLPQADPRIALLPYCSTQRQLPEHARNVLSDICHSMPDVAQAATSHDGREYLRQYLPEPNPSLTTEGIIGFWETDYVVN